MKKEQIDEKIIECKKYEDGWDSYGSPKPSEASIRKALEYSYGLEKLDVDLKVLPTVDGGVVFAFVGDGFKRAVIEILNEPYSNDEPDLEWLCIYSARVDTYQETISLPINPQYRLAYLSVLKRLLYTEK